MTPITEIGVLLGLNEISLRDDILTPGHPAREAFYRGYAKTALKIRQRNLELAEAGSPAADEALRAYLKTMNNDL
ncbi:MAG: hypothetical protein K5683_02840 [Prevotella sp.]|nr:hypothetical protein [Prevotella sp.]